MVYGKLQLFRQTARYLSAYYSEFVEYDLLDYAKNNPSVVVYLKPRRHKTAVIKAEYRKS